MNQSGGNSCGSEGVESLPAARPNKPRVSYADLLQWQQAFERLKVLPRGTKLVARGLEFKVDGVLDAPHPPSLWLKVRHDGALRQYIVRRGDSLMMELKEVSNVSTG